MINLFLQQGAETLFSDFQMRTVIHYACIVGVSKNVLQLLLDYNDKMTNERTHTDLALKDLFHRKPNINDFPNTARTGRKSNSE